MKDKCPFCQESVKKLQCVHETPYVMTLYNLTPTAAGNLIIIPKRHIESFQEISLRELIDVRKEIYRFAQIFPKAYGVSEYVLLQKNGTKAGQSVAHIHFHMIPASISFDEIVHTAFHHREKISQDEMQSHVDHLKKCL